MEATKMESAGTLLAQGRREEIFDLKVIAGDHIAPFQRQEELEPERKSFWNQKVAWVEAGDLTPEGFLVARVDGFFYVVGPDDGVRRSFDGRPYVIRFVAGPHAGREIHTTNLWCIGSVPASYQEELTDNAVLSTI